MADEKKKAAPKRAAKAADKAAPKKDAAKKAPAKKKAAPKAASKSAKKAPPKATAEKKAPAKAAPKKAAKKPVALVVRASSRHVRVAPRKARLVADQVRGMHIDKARALLQFSPRSAAADIQKLIDSAASNAENNHDLVADEMRVAEITVDEGPTLYRYRPSARLRGGRIRKRTCHIAVALSPEEERGI
jgi:large subunit ribosomal protein L22